MSLPVEFEVLIPVFLGALFSFLYESDPDNQIWAGMVAMVTWLTAGMLFLITSTYPVVSLIFNAIGIIYIIRLVINAFKPLRNKRRLDDE